MEEFMRCLTNPVLCRVLMRVQCAGRATAKQLAAETGLPLSSIYRHLARLERNGLVEVVERNPVRGLTEKVYAVGDAPTRIEREQLAQAGAEGLGRLFFSYLLGLAGEFADYEARGDTDLVRDMVSFTTAPVCASAEELRGAMTQIGEIIAGLTQQKPAPGRRMHSIALVITPPRSPDEADKKEE